MRRFRTLADGLCCAASSLPHACLPASLPVMLNLPVYMLVRRTDSRPVVVGEGANCVVLLFTQQKLAE